MNQHHPLPSPSAPRIAAALLVMLTGCSVADPVGRTAEDTTAEEEAALTEQAALGGPARQHAPGPKMCQAESDCADACPPGSQGCTCHQVPHGPKLCLPTCAADADCPDLEVGPTLVCMAGVCAPDGPPPPPPGPPGGEGPPLCSNQADCDDGCPEDFAGCACHQPPHGPKICVPTCSADADCPSIGEGFGLNCVDGICAPPMAPPPPPGR